MRDMDELRELSSGEALDLWRNCREDDPLERAVLCNARILARCCLWRGQRVYQEEREVLDDLTGRQMEALLRKLAAGGGMLETAGSVNPAFDPERFRALGEGR